MPKNPIHANHQNASTLTRALPALAAVLLIWVLARGFVPGGKQLDFWVLTMVALVVVSLPLLLLEFALAKRQSEPMLTSWPRLTRDADASPRWRLLGWAGLLLMGWLAGTLINQAIMLMLPIATAWGPLTATSISWLSWMGVLIVTSLLSQVNTRVTLLVGLGLAALSLVGRLINVPVLGQWQWTGVSLGEWAQALSLAVLAGGIGFGLYWQYWRQLSASGVTWRSSASLLLPLTLASGAVALTSTQYLIADQNGFFDWITWAQAGASICAAAFLMNQAGSQLPRLGWLVAIIAIALLSAIGRLTGHQLLIAALIGILVTLGYSLFVGWQMKISHVRKSLALPQEGMYNVWRMVIRIVVPLALILGLIGWISLALSQQA